MLFGVDHRFGHNEGSEIPARAFANFAPLRLCEKPGRVDGFLAKAQRREVCKDSSQGCAVSVWWPKRCSSTSLRASPYVRLRPVGLHGIEVEATQPDEKPPAEKSFLSAPDYCKLAARA